MTKCLRIGIKRGEAIWFSLGGDGNSQSTEESTVVELTALEENVGLVEIVDDLSAMEEHVH